MNMETIRIELDYLQGAIWISNQETGEPLTGVDIIDKDEICRDLNLEISDLYSSYYEFDSHDMPCWFNYEQEFNDRFIMRDLLQKIVNRLDELNDGSYTVEAIALDYYKDLCNKETYVDLNKR